MDKLGKVFSIRESLITFLREDIGKGDITSNSVIPGNASCQAKIVCKSKTPAIVCGLEEAAMVFDICKCKYQILINDGSKVKKGVAVMDIHGKARSILKAERTALNLVMRMSGIASETRKLVSLVTKYQNNIKIACTRKTAPGLRLLDKKAVTIGGGHPHRVDLYDMALIKDNHLIINGSITKSIQLARKGIPSSKKVECEVVNLDQALEAIKSGADVIMLDNFNPQKAAKTIKSLTRMKLRHKAMIEISGGITSKNVTSYAKAKPDIISIGYLTHSVQAIDFSLSVY
jgi:nicotinate-nucleotide pyrophosphorylase (carboxylating)